ncbi:MAG: MerR family transcriptional regulator [Ferruginibacter sp.]
MPIKQTTFDFAEDAETSIIVNDPVIEQELVIEIEEKEVKPVEQTVEPTLPKKSVRGRMKLKDMSVHADLLEIPTDEILFQKSYYSIGKVAEMFKENISLIRFWENEFDILKPKKNSKGDRFFRPEDVKNLQLIYHLLREKKYTIEGAKEFLRRNNKAEAHFAAIESLKQLKLFLQELKANL